MDLKKGLALKNKFMRKIAFKIYHWCIPSQHNEHFPHIWREKPFKVLVFALIFLQCLSLILILGMPQTKIFAVISEDSLVKLTNEARNESSLLGLAWNESLAKAAQLKAEDMLNKSYFSHNSPQGTTPWYWIQKAGYKYHFAGENLAMNFTNSKSVSDAWLKSPSHRANILNSNYSEIGIAIKNGKINGKETTIVVEFFASPSSAKATALGILKSVSNKTPSLSPSPNSAQEAVFATIAPAFTIAPNSSTASEPKILAGSTSQSLDGWPKQKAAT
ncbi:MAG: CAP domain-containing protein [Patescibacteria group bacterium]